MTLAKNANTEPKDMTHNKNFIALRLAPVDECVGYRSRGLGFAREAAICSGLAEAFLVPSNAG